MAPSLGLGLPAAEFVYLLVVKWTNGHKSPEDAEKAEEMAGDRAVTDHPKYA